MVKVVINRCWRGALLSEAGLKEYVRRSNNNVAQTDIKRDDKDLVAMMEESNTKWCETCAEPKVIEVADDAVWRVRNVGKKEWLAIDA